MNFFRNFYYIVSGTGADLFSETCLQVALEEEVTHVVLVSISDDHNQDATRRLKNYGLKVIFRCRKHSGYGSRWHCGFSRGQGIFCPGS